MGAKLNKNTKTKFTEIEITYKSNDKRKRPLRILGDKFVENNKDNSIIIYKNKKYKLEKYFKDIDKNYNNKDIIKFKLQIINDITDISYMFDKCYTLLVISNNLSKLDTSKIKDMQALFFDCYSLKSLPDISKWNTSNVEDMNCLFSGCKSLLSLPDISKWDTKNIKSMSRIFDGCYSLISLPDISKWDTKKVSDMVGLFSGCCSLISLPDISKWNTKNARDMRYIFEECNSLISLPDISKWNTKNVDFMFDIFFGCFNCLNIPPNFKNNNDSKMDELFENMIDQQIELDERELFN